MKPNITLVIGALTVLLVGFNSDILGLTSTPKSFYKLYDLCDSVAWVMFSFFAMRIANSLKTIGKPDKEAILTDRVKLLSKMFFLLSICPLVNEIAGFSTVFLWGNYLYGMSVMIYYTVKICRSGRHKK